MKIDANERVCSMRSRPESGPESLGSPLPESLRGHRDDAAPPPSKSVAARIFSRGLAAPNGAGVQLDVMRVTIQLPDDISAALEGQWDDVPRRSLEAIAVEGYRTGALTEPQVRKLLGLDTRFHVHALLKEHHAPLQYTSAGIEDDLRAQRELGILPGRRSSWPTAGRRTI